MVDTANPLSPSVLVRVWASLGSAYSTAGDWSGQWTWRRRVWGEVVGGE